MFENQYGLTMRRIHHGCLSRQSHSKSFFFFFQLHAKAEPSPHPPHPSDLPNFFSLLFQSDTMDFLFFFYPVPKRLRALCSAHSIVFRSPLSKCTLCKSIVQKTLCEINDAERTFPKSRAVSFLVCIHQEKSFQEAFVVVAWI